LYELGRDLWYYSVFDVLVLVSEVFYCEIGKVLMIAIVSQLNLNMREFVYSLLIVIN